ncbi:MAG: TldD/PmbA family protein [Candidatus Ranarchaeia archaeon]
MDVSLLNPAQQLLNTISHVEGLESTEVYLERETRRVIRMIRGEFKINEIIQEGGGAIRLIKGQRVGFSTFTEISLGREAFKRALSIANVSKPNPYAAIPAHRTVTNYKPLFDKRLLELTPADLSETLLITRDVLNAPKIHSKNATIKIIVHEKAIANTNGIETAYKSVALSFEIECNAKKDDISSYGHYGIFTRDANDIPDIHAVASRVRDDAILQLNRVNVESGDMDIILHPLAAHELLSWAMAPGLLGHNILKNASPFIGKMGETVGPDVLTIIDNGRDPCSLYACPFDDEGTPRQNTLVISKGILSSFLYDETAAREAQSKMKRANETDYYCSTGNSGRFSPYDGRSYTFPPTVSTNELYVQPGSASFSEMLRGISNGLYIIYPIGAHSSNISSGAFNIVPYAGFVIKDGELQGGIKEAIISSNIPDFIKKISVVGNDPIRLPITWNQPVTSPHLVLEDVKIIGG